MENNNLKDAKKQFSNIGLVLVLGAVLIYGIQFLSMGIANNIPAIADNTSLYLLMAMLPMYVIAFPIIFLVLKKIPAEPAGEKQKMSFPQILAAFCVAYAVFFISNIIGNMLTTAIGMVKGSAVENTVVDLVTGDLHPAVSFFIFVICAPIAEELLFRKAVISRTAKYGDGIAIIFSALLFGLYHGNLNQFVYAFSLGLALGFIYLKTNNIRYTILLHMLVNFMGSILGILVLKGSGYLELMNTLGADATETELMSAMMEHMGGLLLLIGYYLFLFALVIAGIIIFFVNKKKIVLSAGSAPIAKGQRFKTIILNIGMLLYCIFWIAIIIWQLVM